MVRKGMGKGKGKGYKNMIPKDPKVHSDSSRGRKQPQNLSPRVKSMLKKDPMLKNKSFKDLQKSGVFLRYQADSDHDGVSNIHDCKPLDKTRQDDMPVTEIEYDKAVEKEGSPEKESFFSKTSRKTGRFLKKEAIAGAGLVKTELQKRKERREKQRIAELEEVNHPLIKTLKAQKERVDEIKTQIAETDEEFKEDKLFTELEKEQNQLRDIQEKVTELEAVDLSDRELKTLAIRWRDDSLFGSSNPYTKELKRRIKAEKDIEKELDEERNKKAEGGFFG